ncbi:MAG: protein-L-isoaspartate(D-aspartate) O-methyltransferase [Chloroflexi bacterium]|nr:protein-L-isoaspartate(D-aspartate) O-methyltransferase [Chloroflexota bacterium]
MPARHRETAEEHARREMVETQLRRRGIADERVLAAMAELPREAFMAEMAGGGPAAYRDAAAPIDEGQTISQPYIVARMTELLRVAPGDRVLEIGTGSGYQAAVLARLGVRVHSIERFASLASSARERLAALGIEGVEIEIGDGSRGHPGGAPWDGIIVTAAAPSVPASLREQLEIGAHLVIPVGRRGTQALLVVERRGPADWIERSDGPVVFVPLVGAEGFPDPALDAPGGNAPGGGAPG